jgi:uncharacterized protein
MHNVNPTSPIKGMTMKTVTTLTTTLTSIAAAVALSISTSAIAQQTETVSFQSKGENIKGVLYTPSSRTTAKLPVIIVAGSLTSVKEQMSAAYAQKLSRQGFAVLTFDYRGFGESDGKARQFESPAQKQADFRAAVDFLQGHPVVDKSKISVLGICTSGGNVLEAAATDARIKAVVTVAGWFVEPQFTPMLYGGEAAVKNLQASSRAAANDYAATGRVATVQTYGLAGSGAAHAGDHMDYYVNPKRGAIPQFINSMAVMSWEGWLAFNPVAAAPKVTQPTLIVHSDDSALPDQARKVYGLLGGKKELAWLKGGHFEFYDNDAKVGEATTTAATFLRKVFL